jgi:hypothetical protein
MGVKIDQAGGDDAILGVFDMRGFGSQPITHGCHFSVFERDIGDAVDGLGGVDDTSTAYDKIKFTHGIRLRCHHGKTAV